jgi:heme/copper-type cytochrome/quinol oxidase subunit 2
MNGILRHSWKPLTIGALGGALFALVACGSAGSTGSTSNSPVAKQAVTMNLYGAAKGKVGPDGLHHDTYSPDGITTTKGTSVTVTIISYDDVMHSFTSPELGLSVIVQPAKNGQPTSTTFTFTPTRTGKFRFYCAIPCDTDAKGWAMKSDGTGPGHAGYMAGYVIVN